MKCENELKIGDVVKSLDFVGNDNYYCIGLVTEVFRNETFRAKTIKRVQNGETKFGAADEFFVAPLLGSHFFDDMAEAKGREPRIQVIA